MIVLLLSLFQSYSMPYPMSQLHERQTYYESQWGFKISDANKKEWLKVLADASDPYHLVTYKKLADQKSEARLNIRVDPVSLRNEGKTVTLKSYVEHWIKQYPKLGLEVLKKDYRKFNGKKAARIDAYNFQSKQQIRQYVIWKEKNALILSCSDAKEAFSSSIYQCEKLLRSIEWTDES